MKYTVSVNNEMSSVEIRDKVSQSANGEVQTVFFNDKPVKVDGCLNAFSGSAVLLIDDKPYEVFYKDNGRTMCIHIGRTIYDVHIERSGRRRGSAQSGIQDRDEEIVTAPMPGMVVTVKVETDQIVERGEPLLILEAMKMENQLRCPVEGRILKVCVDQGQKVEKGEKLVIIGLQRT